MSATRTSRSTSPTSFDVLLYLPEHNATSRQVTEAVIRHASRLRNWNLVYYPGPAFHARRLQRHADVDGVITRVDLVDGGEMLPVLATMKARVVLVEQDPVESLAGAIAVRADDVAVGRMALSYFADRGFAHVAFVASNSSRYCTDRREGFAAAAAERDIDCHILDGRDPELHEALASLPRPCGLLADHSRRAHEVASLCRDVGIAVPEEIAILGVDDDELLCEAFSPTLSSINQGTTRIGLEAAALLDRWLITGETPPRLTLVPPQAVVTRQSTETLAVPDPDVAAALRLIREQACEGLSVPDVLAAVPVARRTLELRFRRLLGRTIHAEIVRRRVEHAQHLLLHTRLSMAEITVHCGFSYISEMSKIFKRQTGQTPTAFRRGHGQCH